MPVGRDATTATVTEEDRDDASPAGWEKELGHIKRDWDEGQTMMLWLLSIFSCGLPQLSSPYLCA